MTNSLDARAKRIIDDLIESSADVGTAAVDRACGEDRELAGRVRELLAAIRRQGEFLSDPTVETPPGMEQPGTTIGPYKLLQIIGEGGMGIVYMAEQVAPVQRKVALKIIKPGMDSAQVIARFEAERQALAMMDHLNIARVLDAGTTARDRPYFVMELVQGVPITQFCDDRRLSARDRLELFVPVCHAIQHAHQKGIIHRDIKPSNVLVTMYDDKPVPKVIDFGVAKAVEQRLTDKTMFTEFGALLGTVQYISPEQAEMNAFGVDTRSDIYSLGVLLYELLTGTTPLEAGRVRDAAFTEVVRMIKEEEAPRPSIRLSTSNNLRKLAAARGTEPIRLSMQVRGDVDWIVMKCLEKDRARRYDSANGLARDIQRHLADEPVEACPPSAGYRLRKFTRRHRAPIAVGGAFVLLLIVGTIISARAAVRATAAEKLAQQEKEEADTAKAGAESQRDQLARVNQRLELANYVADMNLARHAWDDNNLEQMGRLLERHRPGPGGPDLRGFEWYYLDRLPRQALWSVRAYPGSVRSARFFPDGRRLISGGTLVGRLGMNWAMDTPGEIKMWDADSGRQLPLTLPGLPRTVWGIELSPDGTSIGAAAGKEGARVWDVSGGEPITLPVAAGEGAVDVAFSPDGRQLLVKSAPEFESLDAQRTIRIWDLHERRAVMTLERQSIFQGAPAFSPDGKSFAFAQLNLGSIKVCDVSSGREAYSLKFDAGEVARVVFSPDGKWLFGSGQRGIHRWNTETHVHSAKWPADSAYAYNDAVSRDGKHIAHAGVDGIIEVWDAGSGRKVRTFKGHSGAIDDIAFSPDGSRLVSAGMDGTIRVWALEPVEGSARAVGPNSRPVFAVSPDGRFALRDTVKENVAEVVDLRSGKVVRELLRAFTEFCGWDGPGRRLAVPDIEGHIDVIDTETGGVIRTFQAGGAGLYVAALTADGGTCAYSDAGRVIVTAEVASGRRASSIEGMDSLIHNLVFSPDGTRVAAADVDGWVRVFDVGTGRRISETRSGEMYVYSMGFNADGTRVSVVGVLTPTTTGEVRLIDADAGGVLRYLRGHNVLVINAAFSPDGRRLATASSDQTVRIWETSSGQELLALRGHESQVMAVRFLDSGSRLRSVGSDGETRIWDASPLPGTDAASPAPQTAPATTK